MREQVGDQGAQQQRAPGEVLDQHVITNMFGRFATGQGSADDVIKEAIALQKQIYQKRGLG